MYLKFSIIRFVCDAVFDFWTEKHLLALQVVEHDVLQRGQVCLEVNQVKVNNVIRGDLNSLIPFNKLYRARYVKCMIYEPSLGLRDLIKLKLNE